VPYWFDVEATAYVGSSGRAAARLRATYDIRLSQRFLLTPELQTNAYSKTDEARRIGSGITDTTMVCDSGMRFGVSSPHTSASSGERSWTAGLARAAGERTVDKQIVASVRIWF
jgi:copper resistance protein B